MALVAFAPGCTKARIVYERDAEVDGEVSDAGMDGGADVGVDAGDSCLLNPVIPGIPEGCELLRPPPRPVCTTDDELPTIEVGFARPIFADDNGYDLDGHCTNITGEMRPSCSNPAAYVPDTTEGGTDNAFGLIVLRALRIAEPTIVDSFTRAVFERGVSAPMLRLEGWNGLPDDAQVAVTIAASAEAALRPVDWESGPVELLPSEGFFSGSGMPLAQDLDAYVSQGKLVATLPEGLPFELSADGRRLIIALRDARIVANLEPGVGPTDFLVVGRWSVASAIATLDVFLPCPENEPVRMAAMNVFTEAADLRVDRAEDMMMLECNAISVVLRFVEPHPIVWGTPRPVIVEPMCL